MYRVNMVYWLPARAGGQYSILYTTDGMRRVVVVPLDSTWAALAAATLTFVDGQRDPCIILSDPVAYVREGDDLGGAQRLAVMAVDFGRWSQRTSMGFEPPCGWNAERRPRQSLQTSSERVGRRGPSAPPVGAAAARSAGGPAQAREGRSGLVMGSSAGVAPSSGGTGPGRVRSASVTWWRPSVRAVRRVGQ